MDSELIDKIAIAELDPKKSYIIEVNTTLHDHALFNNIKEAFKQLGIENILVYRKDDLKITEAQDKS